MIPDKIEWTQEKFDRFKVIYEEAKDNGKFTLDFEGHEFVTDFAKYLIEYLETKFK